MECPHLQVCKEWHELCMTEMQVHDLEDFCKVCPHKPGDGAEELLTVLDYQGVPVVHR